MIKQSSQHRQTTGDYFYSFGAFRRRQNDTVPTACARSIRRSNFRFPARPARRATARSTGGIIALLRGDKFEAMKANGEFAEWAKVHDNSVRHAAKTA